MVEPRLKNEDRKKCRWALWEAFAIVDGVRSRILRSVYKCPHDPPCIPQANNGEFVDDNDTEDV